MANGDRCVKARTAWITVTEHQVKAKEGRERLKKKETTIKTETCCMQLGKREGRDAKACVPIRKEKEKSTQAIGRVHKGKYP
eukprot:273608-Pelagomonas_calceolata.AAC.2